MGHCGRSTACASPGGTGSRSFPAAGHIQGPPYRCPTRPALASAKQMGYGNCETVHVKNRRLMTQPGFLFVSGFGGLTFNSNVKWVVFECQ